MFCSIFSNEGTELHTPVSVFVLRGTTGEDPQGAPHYHSQHHNSITYPCFSFCPARHHRGGPSGWTTLPFPMSLLMTPLGCFRLSLGGRGGRSSSIISEGVDWGRKVNSLSIRVFRSGPESSKVSSPLLLPCRRTCSEGCKRRTFEYNIY